VRRELRGLYVIIDPHVADGRDLVHITRETIAGGARMIQWRDKTREKGRQLAEVEAIAAVCRDADVPLIINDDVDVALLVRANGVHVGQADWPVATVRWIGPPEWIIGASTNNVAEAKQAEADGADYVSVGNLFGTSSKDDTRPATLDVLTHVKEAVGVPVCAIGGISEANIASVIAARADIVSVISAVVASDDPRGAAERLAKAFE